MPLDSWVQTRTISGDDGEEWECLRALRKHGGQKVASRRDQTPDGGNENKMRWGNHFSLGKSGSAGLGSRDQGTIHRHKWRGEGHSASFLITFTSDESCLKLPPWSPNLVQSKMNTHHTNAISGHTHRSHDPNSQIELYSLKGPGEDTISDSLQEQAVEFKQVSYAQNSHVMHRNLLATGGALAAHLLHHRVQPTKRRHVDTLS